MAFIVVNDLSGLNEYPPLENRGQGKRCRMCFKLARRPSTRHPNAVEVVHPDR